MRRNSSCPASSPTQRRWPAPFAPRALPRFSTTTGQSAPLRRISTFGLAVEPLVPCMGLSESSRDLSSPPLSFFRPIPLFDRGDHLFVPTRTSLTPARAEAVKVGRRSGIEAHFDVSRPRLDSFEHGGRLDDYGPEERSVVEFGLFVSRSLRLMSLPDLPFSTSSLFASGCLSFAGSASMSTSRAMIASAYIRQLRSGLPLCCMHGRSRR